VNAEASHVIVAGERTPKRDTTLAVAGGDAFMAMISKAAADPSFDPVRMSQLVDLRNNEIKRLAEEAFNDAMSACQAEMRPVATDADNEQTRSRYATYGALDKALRPIYTKHGFAISYDETDSPKPDHVRILAYVSRGGFTRTYRKDMAVDGLGPKGNPVMTKTHASGSASSYGMRYLLKMIFNVAVGEDDNDGNGAGDYERITDQQAADLNALIQEVGGNKDALLTYFKVDRLGDLPASEYSRVVRTVEDKRKAPAVKTGGPRK
jgi:hypothetical protein